MDENTKIVLLALVSLVDNLGTVYIGFLMGARAMKERGGYKDTAPA